MNKNRARLNLSRVTVRALNMEELAEAHGGELNRSNNQGGCVSTQTSCFHAPGYGCGGSVVSPRAPSIVFDPSIIIVRP